MSSAAINPAAPHHQPAFFTAPGETDILFNVMGIFLVVMVLMVIVFYFKFHALPEQLAHKGQKVQFEIVAVLGLISLFTHNHIFWIAGLLLAFIPMPDFSTPLTGMADSLAKMAGRGRRRRRCPVRREHGAGARRITSAAKPHAAQSEPHVVAPPAAHFGDGSAQHPRKGHKPCWSCALLDAHDSARLSLPALCAREKIWQGDHLILRLVRAKIRNIRMPYTDNIFNYDNFLLSSIDNNAISLFRDLPVLPEGNGRVEEVYVGLREKVKAGQPLFKLDTSRRKPRLKPRGGA